jgi:phosphonate transport system substrate-binding protein
VETVDALPWRERENLLDAGAAHLGVVCGLPYLWKTRRGAGLDLLAAPVMRCERYGGRPIYYSDVVVRAEQQAAAFTDLWGLRWAYNEPCSHSGYHLVRWHLARLGERRGYFREVVQAGSHQAALALLLQGRVDGAAIDSIVLERELQVRPELRQALRVVETLGPSPAPPLVATGALAGEAREEVRAALQGMHQDPSGAAALAAFGIERLAPVGTADYEPIRAMFLQARGVPLRQRPLKMPLAAALPAPLSRYERPQRSP